MAMRSKEFVGKAEGIRSHELSLKSSIEDTRRTISGLNEKKYLLDNELSSLLSELESAENDYDEEHGPDMFLIASINNRISEIQYEKKITEEKIDSANEILGKAEDEYEKVEEEKKQTIFEIRQRARIYSHNISKSNSFADAYDSIGQMIGQSMQESYDALAQAAAILDSSLDSIDSGSGSIGGAGLSSKGISKGMPNIFSHAAIAVAGNVQPTGNVYSGSMSSLQKPAQHSYGRGIRSASGAVIEKKTTSYRSAQTSGKNGTGMENAYGIFDDSAGDKLLYSSQTEHGGFDAGNENILGIKANSSTNINKTKIRGIMSPSFTKAKIDSKETIEDIEKRLSPEQLKYFKNAIEAGGGKEGQKVRLRGTGEEYFLTGPSNGRASGNFLTKEYPGDTARERKENLQLPPGNDAARVEKVRALRPTIVLESIISPQKSWAFESGYTAREGILQVFTPNTNVNGALAAHIYEVINDNRLHYTRIPELFAKAGSNIRKNVSKLWQAGKVSLIGYAVMNNNFLPNARFRHIDNVDRFSGNVATAIAFRILRKAYGNKISLDRIKEIKENLIFLSENEIKEKYPYADEKAPGFYIEKTRKLVIRTGSKLKIISLVSVIIHEFLHGLSHNVNRPGIVECNNKYGNSHNVGLNEGLTEYIMLSIMEKDASVKMFHYSYPEFVEFAKRLTSIYGSETIRNVYFNQGINKIRKDFDKTFGEKGAFDEFSDKIDDLYSLLYERKFRRDENQRASELFEQISDKLDEFERRKTDASYLFRKSMEYKVIPTETTNVNSNNGNSDWYKEEKQLEKEFGE